MSLEEMAWTIDLGSDVFSSELDLDLVFHPSIMLLHPSEMSCTGPGGSLEELIKNGDLWVDQVPELKLHVHVSAGSYLNQPLSIFASCIGDIICSSKIWLELGLGVLFRSCDQISEQESSTTFQLSFGLRRRPNGLVTSTKSSTPSTAKHNLSGAASQDRWQQTSRISSPPKSLESPNAWEFVPAEDYLAQDLLLEPIWRLPLDSNRALLHVEAQCHTENIWVHHDDSTSERTSTCRDTNDIQSFEMSTLFNTGLKALLLDTIPRVSGSAMARETKLLSLSRIAPPVFSPGYRETMNHRSQLIAPLAKSICSIVKSTQSNLLQDKLAAIEALHHTHAEVSSITDTKAAIAASLFRIAQRHVYSPRASKRLNSLLSTCKPHDMFVFLDNNINRIPSEDMIRFQDGSSDDCLATDMNDLNSYTSDDASSPLSFNEEAHSWYDMMDHQPENCDDSQPVDECLWKSVYNEQYILQPTSGQPSDDEMLVSDQLDDSVSSALPHSDVSMLGSEQSFGNNSDYIH